MVMNDDMIGQDYKEKVSDLLKPYIGIGENLYSVEYIRGDRILVLRVETGEDEVIEHIELCKMKYIPTTTKEMIQMAFDGEISEEQLKKHLDSRSDEQIVNDLKNDIDFEGLIQLF